MSLYSAFLAMAPFILLAVTKGAFGPWGEDESEWSSAFLLDVAVVLAIIGGALVSLLVLGDILSPSPLTQWIVVIAGCVALLLLALYMLVEVLARYRSSRS
jgi:hypothetical protein